MYTADKSRIVACPASKNDGTLGLPENLIAHSQETMEEHEKHRVAAINIPPEKVEDELSETTDTNTQTEIKFEENVDTSAKPGTKAESTTERIKEKQGFFSAAKENIVWILLGVVLEMIYIRIRNKKYRKAMKKMQQARRRKPQ